MMQNIGSERFTGTWFDNMPASTRWNSRWRCSHSCAGRVRAAPYPAVAFLESAAAWLPSWLHRLDEHAELVRFERCSLSGFETVRLLSAELLYLVRSDEELLYQVVEAFGTTGLCSQRTFLIRTQNTRTR